MITYLLVADRNSDYFWYGYFDGPDTYRSDWHRRIADALLADITF